jgi:Zn-dependent peptidase ImmA (M78 family)
VEGVALYLGLQIERAKLGDDVSGVLVVADGRGIIGVNSDHSPVRQRFSVAHEIGHFLMHRNAQDLFIDKGYFAAFRDSRSSTGEDRREREANAFAAALLMPARLVKNAVAQHRFDLGDEEALDALAELFQISRQAMTYRVANLGIFTLKVG